MITNKASLLRVQSTIFPSSVLKGNFTVFQIFNGPIEVRSLGLRVCTAAIASGTYPLMFEFTPLGVATPVSLCAVTSIGGASAEQSFFVDGTKTTALVKGGDPGIQVGNVLHMPLVLSEGLVTMNFVGLLTTPSLAIGTTKTNIASSAFTFNVTGTTVSKAAVPIGTAVPVATIPQNKWGLYALTIVAGGTITVTGATGNAVGTYATEAAAIAALPATAAASVLMGYVTVMSSDAGGFIGMTSNFDDGPVTANYYNNTVGAPATGSIKAFMSWYPISMDARVVGS